MTDDRALEIVIVAYRCRELLLACLRSIEAHPYTGGSTAITVVDNASADGTVEALRAAFPRVRIVELPANLGYAAANNVALRASRAELILLLNPDTEIWPGVLDAMAAVLRDAPGVGVAGCRLVRRDGSFDHAAKRSIPTVADALRYFRPGTGSSGYLAPHVAEHGSGAVDAVNGAFMLIRREALHDVGLLDEGYWMYGEDLDWCTRSRNAGWEVRYNGAVTTLHVKGATAGAHRRLRQNVAFHRSMGRFYRRYVGGEHALLDLVVYAGIGAKLGVSVGVSLLGRALARARARVRGDVAASR
jgi:GT2 family glycosyltransferase